MGACDAVGVCEKDLEIYRADIEKCFRCNLCKMVPLPLIKDTRFVDTCPISRHYHFHGYSGSGLQFLAHSVIDGRLRASTEMAEIAYSCRACGYCDVACKSTMDAERTQVIQTLREYLTDAGFAPASHAAALQQFDESGHVDGRAGDAIQHAWVEWARAQGIKVIPDQSAPVALLTGSELREAPGYVNVAQKLALLLKQAGVDVGVMESESENGIGLYWMASRSRFVAAAHAMVKDLQNKRVRTVVTASATTYSMLKAKFYDYGVDLGGIRVLHATEYLLELFEAKKLKLKGEVFARITYHDPCYLGRHAERTERWQGEKKVTLGQLEYFEPPKPIRHGTKGVYDAPRQLLDAITGLQRIEMPRTREHALCCGYGGAAHQEYGELVQATALERWREVESVEVDMLVSACGFCERQFKRSQAYAARSGEPGRQHIQVMDIVELVYKASQA